MNARTIALRNVRGPQHHAVEIPHDYCERINRCSCRTFRQQTSDRDRNGRVRTSVAMRAAQASVTLPRGQWVGGFSPVILRMPGARSNIAAGLVDWRWEEEKHAEPAAPALAPPGDDTHQVEERQRRGSRRGGAPPEAA